MALDSNMLPSFADDVGTLHGLLGNSAVLRRLGYAACIREMSDETPTHSAKCRFDLHPSATRRLSIDVCCSQRDDHYFIVEVFNDPAADSFLLDEWLNQRGVSLHPYPFVLTSYPGAGNDRLCGFVAFLDRHLGEERLAGVLAGQEWEHIPFNWGATK